MSGGLTAPVAPVAALVLTAGDRAPSAANRRQRIVNMAWRSNGNLGRSIAFTEMFDNESLTKMQDPHVSAIWST